MYEKMFSRQSPSFLRKGHQQITGGDADEKDLVIAGVQFVVRYVGSTEVASANGTGSSRTEKPVAQVFEHQKRNSNGKTQKKMMLSVCSKNVSVSDEACGKLVASFPISKITFCNIDNFHDKAFVFVARDKPKNPFKAFVFTCESKSKAREAFKALSLAFIINYECYQASLARGGAEKTSEVNVSLDSPDCDGPFFKGVAETSYEMVSDKEGSSKTEKGTRCYDVMPLRKEPCTPILNVIRPGQERISTPPPTRLIQNKTLLQVTDCRMHTRSSSDPTQFGNTTAQSNMPPAHAAAAPLNTRTDADTVDPELEFTEFARLRSKCRSCSPMVQNYSDRVQEDFKLYDCPNVWGDFQNACPPIY